MTPAADPPPAEEAVAAPAEPAPAPAAARASLAPTEGSSVAGKVEFTAVDFPQANRLTVHILAAVAEHEREMISQRTKAALAAAKARGTRLWARAIPPGKTVTPAQKPRREVSRCSTPM